MLLDNLWPIVVGFKEEVCISRNSKTFLVKFYFNRTFFKTTFI